jgi:Flp pilus assembly protein TadD
MTLSFRSGALLAALIMALAVGPTVGAGDDRSPELQLQMAELLVADGHFQEAIDIYRDLRDATTGRLQVRAWLGTVMTLLRTAAFQDARSEAAALAEAHPRNGLAQALHGDALWAAGYFDEAESQYRRGRELAPGEGRARNGLAKALAARSQLDEAMEEARTAVSLMPREGEFHHTLGYVLERARRYDEAAVSMRNYLNLLPNRDRSQKAMWTGQQVRFLEAFRNRQPLHVDPARDADVHTVPFRIVRDKIVVRGKINGRTQDFVLDTGAELTIVSERVARAVGLAPIVYTLTAGVGQIGVRGLQIGRADRFEVGTLRVENVPTLIKNPPLRDLPTAEVEAFSPLALGYSMTLDYRRNILTMSRTLPARTYDVQLPMRLHRLALVRGQVNGGPVHFVIDTGGEVISVSQATVDNLQMTPVRHIPLKVYGTSGWDPEAFLLTGVDLSFDRISMPNSAVVVLNLEIPSSMLGFELGGIVGHRFLSRYEVAIDLQRSMVGLAGGARPVIAE